MGLSEDATEEQALKALEKLQLARIKFLIELGKNKGVITEKTEAHFTKLAENDYENTAALIESAELTKPVAPVKNAESDGNKAPETIPVVDKQGELVKAIQELSKGSQQGDSNDKSQWTYADWQEKDQKGLAELRKTDFQKYQELAKGYLGKKK
jgi:hypothetical protein